MSDLKPCPFCGSPGEVEKGVGAMRVRCSNRECPIHPQTMIANIAESDLRISQWNTRN